MDYYSGSNWRKQCRQERAPKQNENSVQFTNFSRCNDQPVTRFERSAPFHARKKDQEFI